MTSVDINISETSGRARQAAAVADQSHRAEHSLAEDGPHCSNNKTAYGTQVLGGLLVAYDMTGLRSTEYSPASISTDSARQNSSCPANKMQAKAP